MKKLKELKLKIKIAIIALLVFFITTFVCAIYSTIKVIYLENLIENCISQTNEETCSQEAKKHNFQPARMSQCIQQFDGAATAIRGLLQSTGFYLVQEPGCLSIRPCARAVANNYGIF